jgi:hypothetical protein
LLALMFGWNLTVLSVGRVHVYAHRRGSVPETTFPIRVAPTKPVNLVPFYPGANIFGTEQETQRQIVVESARFLMDSMRLWFNRSEEFETAGDATSDNTITLSEAFYQEITARPIPVEREVIAALAHAPGLLDFYVWIAWKSWTVNGQPVRIPIFGPNGLGHQLGTTEYSVDRTFKHKIGQWLKHVKVLWPECPAQISQDGRFVVVQSSRTSAAVRPVERPVNP